jgi:molybdopterin molybdotransferase
MGARVEGAVRAADRLDDVVNALAADRRNGEPAAQSDLIVTTGGTGHSDADQLRPALEASGARIVVDGISMRPGGPCMIAVLPNGTTVIALPGNPLAAMSALLSVLPPIIAGMQGAAMPQLGRVRSAETTDDRRGRTRLVPFTLSGEGASDAGWHGAAMLRGLARADGLLVVPPEGIRAGESAEFVPLPWAAALG